MRVRLTATAVGVICGVLAVSLLVPGLGEHGIWSVDEIGVFDRSRAATGVALRGLIRSPFVPDALRTFGYETIGAELGVRVFHALAVAALVALAAAVARRRGATPAIACLAGVVALSLPLAIHGGRTVLGNPIGELVGVLAILAGRHALGRGRMRLVAALGGIAMLAISIASSGLLLGGALPLMVLAASTSTDDAQRIRAALWIASAIAIGVTLWLAFAQGDGYIPLLGASKDPAIAAKPQDRRFTAGLQEIGYQLYPWLPLVILGALASTRDRWPALWLVLGTTAAAAWSIVYGPVAAPILVPAALCVAAAIERCQQADTPAAWRRVLIVGALLGVVVLGKDVDLVPSRVATPLAVFEGEHMFPADALAERVSLDTLRRGALLGILLAGLFCARRGRLGRRLDRIPERVRAWLPATAIGIAALHGAWLQSRVLVPELSRLLSPKHALERWQALAAAGDLDDVLAMHRLRDPGLDLYGPTAPERLNGRGDVIEWLAQDRPRVVLVRERDVAGVHQKLREMQKPIFVLDATHQNLRLVANVLPPGTEDINPINRVLFDEPPALRNPTRLVFADSIELIGWDVTEPIVRGREVTLRLAIRVLRPLPAGAKVYTRFLKDKTSRLNTEPQPLTYEVYPPNFWRAGDYILHEQTFTAPWLEIVPGLHDFYLGLRRTEHENFEITVPTEKTGEHGVRVRGKTRHFATIGQVKVW